MAAIGAEETYGRFDGSVRFAPLTGRFL